MRRLLLAITLCFAASSAYAQDLPFAAASDPAAMSALAKSVIAAYQNNNRTAYLETLFRLQLAANDDTGAIASLTELQTQRAHDPSARVRARDMQYLIFARAMADAQEGPLSFDAAYTKEFSGTLGALDGVASSAVVNGLSYDNLSTAKRSLEQDIEKQKDKQAIALDDAVQLIRDYNDVQVYTALAAKTAALIAEDDARHYITQTDIPVPTPDGAIVCALVMRPTGSRRIPALLQFTIYNDVGALMREVRRTAAEGYAGVIGLTRGKGCGAGPIAPYEHDGADADTLIEWIAAQPWSNGQVGMYGGSYSGFTPWAAAKHRPEALKAIMVGAPAAPGIDVPMEGNVVWNFLYPWPFYTTDNKTLDNATYNDSARWQKLDHDWYASGRAYRDLDKVDGTPNPVFDRWVDHPSYDAYWQALIPYKTEFAHVGIPVLQTAGYFFGGPGAATYYFGQHRRYDHKAEDTLLIGPYDHFMAQRGTIGADENTSSLAGYTFDDAAQIDLVELRYRWFDYVLRGGPKPAILAGNVNYEVPGANMWKHAASLDAMARGMLTFHLGGARGDGTYVLGKSAAKSAITQTVNFADRSDVDKQAPGGGVEDKDLDTTNAVAFVSDPLAKATELSGLFDGRLDFVTNKKDFDFQISLYELTKDGHYIQLAPYWSRASYVSDLTRRHLLVPGRRLSLSFRSIRLMSRMAAAGSRVVAVLGVIKEPGREINYGTGGIVADETIADARVPLKIRWLGSSVIRLPLGR